MATGTAVIIGSGIGGLTAGLALANQGWTIHILERAPSIEPAGAGLAMAPNALRALDTLGLGDPVRERAALGSGGIRRWNGGWLLATDADRVRREFGDTVVVLRRSELVDLLLASIPAGAVRTGHHGRVTDPGDAEDPARVEVIPADHQGTPEDVRADLVVAADGARSATRSTLVGDHHEPVYAGFTAWRLVTAPGTADDLDVHDCTETWGPGGIVGLMRLADDAVYGYATAATPPGTHSGDERAALLDRFAGWHSPIPAVLAATEPETVLRNDVWHLPVPPSHSHRGRVALLGDAAHPMAPNLGQGACQAVEDAVVLAHALGSGEEEPSTALAAYSAARTPRTATIVRNSARAGRLTHLRSRPALAVRDTALAIVGRAAPGLFYQQLEATFGWRPPTAHPHHHS